MLNTSKAGISNTLSFLNNDLLALDGVEIPAGHVLKIPSLYYWGDAFLIRYYLESRKLFVLCIH